MLDRDSAEHGYQCLIAIQQNMDVNAWSRFKIHSFDFRAVNLYLILSSDQLISISIWEVMIYLISVNPPECTLYSYHAVYWFKPWSWYPQYKTSKLKEILQSKKKILDITLTNTTPSLIFSSKLDFSSFNTAFGFSSLASGTFPSSVAALPAPTFCSFTQS